MYDAARTTMPRLDQLLMKTIRLCMSLNGLVFLAACAKEPPPVSVPELMENPRLLEAAMVRCGQNRAEMKYEAECVNARDAANRLEAREKRARQRELEALSERKRQALRRTQQAAAEARRRAAESAQQREQSEYLEGEDGESPAGATGAVGTVDPGAVAEGNAPGMEISPPEPENAAEPALQNAAETAVGSDLESIREELKRRQEEPQ